MRHYEASGQTLSVLLLLSTMGDDDSSGMSFLDSLMAAAVVDRPPGTEQKNILKMRETQNIMLSLIHI